MDSRWTPEQQTAFEWMDSDVCVAAGAGSGKTGVLVERFVRIVRLSAEGKLPEPLRAGVDQILVITFTDKATREMKSRIVMALNAAGMERERRQVESAYISTMHAFCARVLKENPFEAGVDPQFRMLSEPEADRLLRAAFETVLEQAHTDGDSEIEELAASAQNERLFGADARDPVSALEKSVFSVLKKLRGAGRRPEDLQAILEAGPEYCSRPAREVVAHCLSEPARQLARCAVRLEELAGCAAGALETKRRNLLSEIRTVSALPENAAWEDLAALAGALRSARDSLSGHLRPRSTAGQCEMELSGLLESVRNDLRGLEDLLDMDAQAEQQSEKHCYRFLKLIHAVWIAYAESCRRQGVLDNDDLQSEAVHLLERSPGVRVRYAARFRHILVDEFQDTSPLQIRLIDSLCASANPRRRLADGPPATRGAEQTGDSVPEPQSLFVVGDVQQSIYAFRDAAPDIFQRIEREFRDAGRGRHVSLARNFRSRPEILRFVNWLFGQVWGSRSNTLTPLVPGTDYPPVDSPPIELLVGASAPGATAVEAEAAGIAERIRKLVRDERSGAGEPIRYGDIAVLMRQQTDIARYERAFEKREIPYFVVGGGKGYYARSEIRDVVNFLTVIDRPFDDVALVAALRSPIAGVSADTLYALARHADRTPLYARLPDFLQAGRADAADLARIQRFYTAAERLRADEDRIPVGRLLERMVQETEYDARLLLRPNGRRRLANVRKLLMMANADPRHGIDDFIRRCRDMETLSDSEGDAPTEEEASDVVRFITIHKAKGLEFPVVILADMARSLTHPERDVFTCDPRRLAIACKTAQYRSAAHIALARARQTVEKGENQRLLYVALTRAREKLILSGSMPLSSRNDTWSHLVFPLCGVLGAPDSPRIQTVADGLRILVSPMSL